MVPSSAKVKQSQITHLHLHGKGIWRGDHLEDQGADGMILKWIINKQYEMVYTRSIWLRKGSSSWH
jgi:hypothetical protein